MHIGILVTNTDESPFAQRHLEDGEKFRQLLSLLRPNWTFSIYSVKDNIFPADVAAFNGFIVTGSPASVHDKLGWIARLMLLIKEAHSRAVPMYGTCFGHQAIAQALGGTVGKNPDDWVLGCIATQLVQPWDDESVQLSLYAAHQEQVAVLPPLARSTGTTPGCRFASFAIDHTVWTTQYHPEMTHEFMDELIDELAPELTQKVVVNAKQSLSQKADNESMHQAMIAFFENAASRAN